MKRNIILLTVFTLIAVLSAQSVAFAIEKGTIKKIVSKYFSKSYIKNQQVTKMKPGAGMQKSKFPKDPFRGIILSEPQPPGPIPPDTTKED